MLGVPRAGRTGTERRGLSAEVAEAALKFPDAFEPLVKILEIGGLQTLLAGKSSLQCFVRRHHLWAGRDLLPWDGARFLAAWPCRAAGQPAPPQMLLPFSRE